VSTDDLPLNPRSARVPNPDPQRGYQGVRGMSGFIRESLKKLISFMGNIFNDIPVNFETGALLRITLNCSRQEATFSIDFYYIVSKFDYKWAPGLAQSGLTLEQEPVPTKRITGDFLSLSNFCDKWCQYVLEDELKQLFSTDISFLDIKLSTVNK
jgi:hypothetical protein